MANTLITATVPSLQVDTMFPIVSFWKAGFHSENVIFYYIACSSENTAQANHLRAGLNEKGFQKGIDRDSKRGFRSLGLEKGNK